MPSKDKMADTANDAEPDIAAANDNEPTLISLGKEEEEVLPSNTKEPDNYFLKHKPSYQEGQLWLAKTLIERDRYDEALRWMSDLEKNSKVFDDVKEELASVQAYYYVKRKDYDQAIAYLDEAIEIAGDRERKARYAFIAAQLYQKQSQSADAVAGYERVLKYKPSYEMAFSAKLNITQNAYLNGRESSEEAKSKLEKMLEDPKNRDFKDRIYYTIAQIDLKDGKKDLAIANLQKSLNNNRNNRAQKIDSYYLLGQLFYEAEEFVSAKSYIDSTLAMIVPQDERHDPLKKLSTNLTEIAKNLKIIADTDSLLTIAAMSDVEKQALAFKIQKAQDAQRRKQLEKQAQGGNINPLGGRGRGRSAIDARQKETSFFAYDQKAVKRGEKEFAKKWGERQLEDNWRRSNRQDSDITVAGNDNEEEQELILTPEEIKQLLGDVPETDAEKETAHLKIREAMYALGSLYRDRIENDKKAADILEELNEKYPASNYELDSWYLLYLAYTDLNSTAKVQEYYQKITNKYPTSTYAKILSDPNYAAVLKTEETQLNEYYDQAYAKFTNGKYQDAYDQSNHAKQKFGASNVLQPRFALLSAMCLGNLQGKEAYINGLRGVIAKYPTSPEQLQAKEMLRLLGEGTGAKLPGDVVVENEEELEFKLDDDRLHYMIVIFYSDIKFNEMKIQVADYNNKYHKLEKLRISNIYLGKTADSRLPMVVVRRFKNKGEAMKYYSGVERNKGEFIKDSNVNYDVFPITQSNYRTILKNKSLGNYKSWFIENYVN